MWTGSSPKYAQGLLAYSKISAVLKTRPVLKGSALEEVSMYLLQKGVTPVDRAALMADIVAGIKSINGGKLNKPELFSFVENPKPCGWKDWTSKMNDAASDLQLVMVGSELQMELNNKGVMVPVVDKATIFLVVSADKISCVTFKGAASNCAPDPKIVMVDDHVFQMIRREESFQSIKTVFMGMLHEHALEGAVTNHLKLIMSEVQPNRAAWDTGKAYLNLDINQIDAWSTVSPYVMKALFLQDNNFDSFQNKLLEAIMDECYEIVEGSDNPEWASKFEGVRQLVDGNNVLGPYVYEGKNYFGKVCQDVYITGKLKKMTPGTVEYVAMEAKMNFKDVGCTKLAQDLLRLTFNIFADFLPLAEEGSPAKKACSGL